MTSTYTAYRLFSQDLSASLARTEAKTDVAREAQYYKDNIDAVTSVDDFLNDRRLFSYAMKAHGLEDMVYAKAFMKKVLTSDLADPQSFAKKLVDTRFVAFAQAFNFTERGDVAESLSYVQNEIQETDTASLYSEHRVKQGIAAATEADYYQTKMPTISSVDDFIADKRLLAYAMTAFGIDPRYVSDAFVRSVLTSDLSDPDSTANKIGDGRYQRMAAAFNFAADGGIVAGSAAQSGEQIDEAIYLNYANSGNGASPAAAAHSGRYYADTIGAIASVDDFLNDNRLLGYALTAYGINPGTASKDAIRQVLTSDLADPDSYANSLVNPSYRTLAAAFHFGTDGSVTGSEGAQTDQQVAATADLYIVNYDDAAETSDASATESYRNRIGTFGSVDALIADKATYSYVLKAFGLDPNTESKSKIRQVLISDSSDPRSFANLQKDTRYRDLAAAFNFGADGEALQPQQAQTDMEEAETVRLYGTRVGSAGDEAAKAKDEIAYYRGAIAKVRSVDGFLADKRLVAYVLEAYDVDGENVSMDTLRRVLTSDPMDEDSYVNRTLKDDRLRNLAAAFNFTADGKLGRVPAQTAQTRSDVLTTSDAYVRQTMESDAGQENEGVRLALYFQRKAAGIKSPLNILADKGLLQVMQTATGLPSSMSQAGIEQQVAMIEKKLDVADLQDPRKLEAFLARFSALYDIDNGVSTPSPALMLLSGETSGVGTDVGLLASLQRLALGRL